MGLLRIARVGLRVAGLAGRRVGASGRFTRFATRFGGPGRAAQLGTVLRGARRAIGRGATRLRSRFKPKGRIKTPVRRGITSRALRFGAKTALGAGAFIAAESVIRRAIRSRAPKGEETEPTRGADPDVTKVGRGVGTGVGAVAGIAAGGRMGLLRKLGAAAAIGGGLFAAEQVAERLGVRGGAGFIGRRPAAAEAQMMGFRRRRGGRRLMITKPELKAVRSLKGKVKRISKALSLIGMKVVRSGARAMGPSTGVITRTEARKAFRK